MPAPARKPWFLALLGGTVLIALPVLARADDDATPSRIVLADTVRVEASKVHSRLADLATTVSVLSAAQIRMGTSRGTQDVLAPVPGAHVIDLSGSGSSGAVEARGFAAQGTTSAMLVLVDEIPVNDFETGRVDWTLLQPAQIRRVEFLRGPASFLYGNATMAGLVNLVTRDARETSAWAEASGGSFGAASVSGGGSWSARRAQGAVSGAFARSDGYRSHSAARWGTGYAFVQATLDPAWGLKARVLAHGGRTDVPGPLDDPQWRRSPRTASTPDDSRNDHLLESTVEVNGRLSPTLDMTALVSGDVHHLDATETVVPVGTNDRTSRSRGGRTEWRLHWASAAGIAPDLLVGVEARTGRLESRYFGDESPGARVLVGAGDVRRNSAGAFAVARARVAGPLFALAGARFDWLRSRVTDPTSNAAAAGSDDQRAASPTLGLTWAHPGATHAWASYTGAFKAPELEQLYDRRPYDLGAGPQLISNNALQPQRGDHWDLGARTRAGAVWLDGALYYARARNELGFDYGAFRIANIARSRHAGFEGQVSLAPAHGISGSLSYAYTRATFEGGDNDGRQINTVPEHQLFARISAAYPAGGTLTLEVQEVARQWIDEANTLRLPDYTLLNVGWQQAVGPIELVGSVRNLGDVRYASVGYVALGPVYFPSAPRTFSLGARFELQP